MINIFKITFFSFVGDLGFFSDGIDIERYINSRASIDVSNRPIKFDL